MYINKSQKKKRKKMVSVELAPNGSAFRDSLQGWADIPTSQLSPRVQKHQDNLVVGDERISENQGIAG